MTKDYVKLAMEPCCGAERLYLVSTSYSSAGVVVKDGEVVDAAPIYRWMVGKRWEDVLTWNRIEKVQPAPCGLRRKDDT